MPRVVDHEARRTEIAAAACQAIAECGIEGVKLTDVGEAAGCTTGAITHYFADKNEVLVAALDHAGATMNVRMERVLARDPDDAVGLLAEALPLDRKGRAEIVVWYSFWSRALADRRLTRRQRAMHRRWLDRVEALLASLAERGEAELAAPLPEEAEALAAMINGIGLRASLDPREWPKARQIAQLRRYLDRLRPRG